MRMLAVILATVATLFAAGCAVRSREATPPAAAAVPEPPLPAGATLTRDPSNGTVRFLKGQDLSRELDVEPMFTATRNAGDAEGVARTFLAAYAPLFRLDQIDQELVLRRIDLDKNGSTHVRFDQVYRDMPILESQLIVHLDRNRRVVLVSGKYVTTPTHLANATPKLTADDARTIAAREGALAEGACAACKADLVVFLEKYQAPRLAWRVGVPLDSVGALERTIDAENGALLRSVPVALSKKWRQKQQ
jgi:Zn-dependent metalloprotease